MVQNLRDCVTRRIALVSIAALAPYSVYHFYLQDWAIAVLLGVISIGAAALVLYIRRGGSPEFASHYLALTYTLGSLYVVHEMGVVGTYWLYPVVLSNFYILPLASALAMNVAVVVLGTWLLLAQPDLALRLCSTLSVVSLFGYIFSGQVRSHHEALSSLSLIDPLTLALNRRALDEDLSQVVKNHTRHGTRFSALMLDIDHFKKINDRFDHHVGDAVLQGLVELIRQRLRATDRLYRYGGEEFLVIAEHTGLVEAEGLAKDLRQRAQAHDFESVGDVTLSIGVAELQGGEHAMAWISRADEAMYLAKRAGRNRVSVSHTPRGPRGDRPDPGGRLEGEGSGA